MNTSSSKANLNRALAALILSAALISLAPAAPLKTGDLFPDLAGFGLEGTLPQVKGKIVLVDFFASWCGPCKESFPVMQDLHKKYADRGLVVVGVNVDKKKEEMEDFLKQRPASFSIVRDAGKRLVSEVRIATMPSSFLIGRDGRIHFIHRGFKGDETRKQYVEEIESLLK